MCRTTMLGARLGSWLLLTALALGVAQAATPGEIDAAKLKPEVLYIDLGNPSSARGIAPANEKEEANLERREVGGMPAAEPKNGAVILKMDPAVVKEETPLLVAFSYYDADRWDEPLIQGFLHAPDRHGFYTGTPTTAGAYSETWRWWTTFTYANYRGYVRDGVQANFRLKVKSIRWVLVLPLQDASIKQMNGIREKALGMLGEYSRLLVAEAALQESRNRLEQGMKYVQSGGQVPPGVSALFAETKAGAGQARVEMNRVILEVLEVLDPAYLGLFDGQDTERLSALDAFALKARTLAGQYRALTARTEKGIAGQIAAQSARLHLKKVVLPAPAKLAPNQVVTPKEIQNHLSLGLVGQIPLLMLPQASLDCLTREQGIDSVYDYSLANWVKPREDGTYDFSDLDRVLGQARGLRVELGMHNIPLADWAQKKFLGEAVKNGTEGFRYGGIRLKAADGSWDGYLAWNGNDYSFCPAASAVWSRSLLRYSLDFHRAVGKHYRDNPLILRYVLNSEGSVTYVAEQGLLWDSALPYYREHLKKTFGDIHKLNQAFGTTYKAFDGIPLPRTAESDRAARLTPALYEYTQLCLERTKYVREALARAVKEGDPTHVVGEVQSSMFGGNVLDSYAVAAKTPFDTFAAGDSDTRTVRYQYSLNRYRPKPIWMYEPYTYTPWKAPEGKGYRIEEASRRMLTANLWTWFFWGHQGLPFFNQRSTDFRSDITDYRIADIMLWPSLVTWNPRTTNPTVRPAAGSLAALKPVQERLLPVLRSAPVVPARIGLLESSTTHRVPWPASATFADIGQLQGRLGQEGKHFFFVPETALGDASEPMAAYRILVAAYATHLRPEARNALLRWVKQGGILIGSGPTGLYDHYGRGEGGLPETVFGMKGVAYAAGITEDSKVAKCSGGMAGREGISVWASKDSYWRLPAKGLAKGTRVLAALGDGTPLVVERAYGAGKVILTATAIGSLLDLYWPLVQAEISAVQPVPEAASSAPDLFLQVRENAAGVRYLSVVSRNISAPVDATITVAGEFAHPRDLTVGQGWPIPATAGGGVTRFKLWLAPGMGTFIELGTSRTKLTGLSPEEENARLAIGRYANLLRRAAGSGLQTTAEAQQLKQVEKDVAAKRYAAGRSRLTAMTQALYSRWFQSRVAKVESRSRAGGAHPVAATWAQSYAAIAQALLKDGKTESAEERLDLAEKTLSEKPAAYPAEVAFPFVAGPLDLKDLASWPKQGWQTVYQDRATRDKALGQFLLVASPQGLYLGAKVRSGKVTDKAQKAGLPWRVMDGVVVHLRCLDRTEALSAEFRSEDTYEITFYADGSVFVWDNLLPCDAKQIRNQVTRTADGYSVAGFLPAEAVRFWPRPGVNVIADVGLFTYGREHTEGYWHGAYSQANTWARARLGEGTPAATAEAGGGATATAALPANTAEACLRVEHWLPQETRGVGRAVLSFDPAEVLPNGKKGAVVLTHAGQAEESQLMTQFEPIGARPGLRVWLKGTGSGGKVELRVTGREGSTWQMLLSDDSKGWRAVDVPLDQCQQTTEDLHNEVLNKFQVYRPRLNRLIVRFARPLAGVKVGLVEYLAR